MYLVSLPYLNGTKMTGGSAIINTNSWVVELNGQHELYESDLETKYVLNYFWAQSFTSLMADLRQYINRVSSFSRSLFKI